MSYQIVDTPSFQDCVEAYRSNTRVFAALGDTLIELMREPFGNPKLKTHAVKRAQGRTFTSYVTNQGHRLIWRLVDRAVVLLLFGEHDAVYRRAENLSLETNPETGVIEVRDMDPVQGEHISYRESRQRFGRLFMGWTDDEMGGLGLEMHEVGVLRALDTEAELLALESRMNPASFEIALRLFLYGLDGEATEVEEEPTLDAEPVAVDAQGEKGLAEAMGQAEASGEFVFVEPDFMLEILGQPIEDWMIFLHPDQAATVRRNFNGPARIRGASGTGKTVVGLHRAAAAARSGERVLFTTFISSLAPVFSNLFARLAPDLARKVEFVHIHGWAREYLQSIGKPVEPDNALADKAWSNAWKRSNSRELKKLGSRYVREEVDSILRGRDIRTLDEYLVLSRTGRRRRISERARREIWEAGIQYATALRRLSANDNNDVLRAALETLRERDEAAYDLVIVDEAQDLNALGLRLCHALCGGQPDSRLLLIGDGQQSVYPGGYRLADEGIELRGRSVLLKTNYRNTREILEYALTVVAGLDFDDGDGQLEPSQREVEILRSGRPVESQTFKTVKAHDAAFATAIAEVTTEGAAGPGDLLVAVPDNHQVSVNRALLGEYGFDTVDLRSYDGTSVDAVRVGTYLRAKGLEFKWVFVSRLDLIKAQIDGADEDRAETLRRQLFVAMARARDGLWVGSVEGERGT